MILDIFKRILNFFLKILFFKRRLPILHYNRHKEEADKLSVCFAITVCDEYEELRNLLNAIIPYVCENDEILIQGDEGNTTDKVKEVIAEYSSSISKFVEFPLNHNFGAYKSQLAKHTNCKYIFQIDADEIPHPYLMRHIHRIIYNNKLDLIRMARINIMIENDEKFILWEDFKDHKILERLNFPDYQRRIYRNTESISWTQTIHEKIIGFKTNAYLPTSEKYCLLHCKHWKKQIERDNQIFNVYRKKTPQNVLIDLSVLKNINCGLGQVAYNYGKYFKENEINDFSIYLLLPKQYFGEFGNHVHYIESKKIYRSFPRLLPHIDVWHSIHQLSSFQPPHSVLNLLTIHDLNFIYEKHGKKAEKYLKKILSEIRYANKITAISQYTQNDIHRIIRNDLDIEVIYNGVEKLNAKDEIHPSFPIDETKPFLFTIGEIKPKKNFHVLLDAMKLMPEYNLYLAGKDDTPYANEIKQRIINENISNVFVTSTIRQQEKIWFYNHCYAFVFPSLFEGFGLPIIEALSFGKPVISSQETSLKEIGSDKVFFLDNFEAEHIANVVKTKSQYFYEHPELVQKNIEYAHSFSYRKHMERYIEIYREMLCDARQK